LHNRRTASAIRLKALTVLGRLRARRGDPDPWSLLNEALELAGPQADGEHLCPLYAGRVETAWLALPRRRFSPVVQSIRLRHFDTTFTAQVGAGRAASRSLMHTQKGTLAYTVPFYPVALNGAGTSTRIYGDVAAGSGNAEGEEGVRLRSFGVRTSATSPIAPGSCVATQTSSSGPRSTVTGARRISGGND
jgi:hypothetical protein